MKRISLTLTLVIWMTAVWGQLVRDYTGSPSAAMGGTSLLGQQVWAARNNPAMLPSLQKKEMAVDHGLLYANSGLSQTAFAFVIPGSRGNGAVYIAQNGYSGFRHLHSGLSFGKKLSDKLDMGIHLAYATFNFGDRQYGSLQYLNSAIGAVIRLPRNIRMAVVVNNLHRPGISSEPVYRESMNLKAGIEYKPGKNTLMMAEVIQPNNARAIFRLGMEYRYHEQFCIRAGIADNADYGQVSFGFGLKHRQLQWNSAASWHPLLGLTPQTGLHYVFP